LLAYSRNLENTIHNGVIDFENLSSRTNLKLNLSKERLIGLNFSGTTIIFSVKVYACQFSLLFKTTLAMRMYKISKAYTFEGCVDLVKQRKE
jgi:hypothetical protein